MSAIPHRPANGTVLEALSPGMRVMASDDRIIGIVEEVEQATFAIRQLRPPGILWLGEDAVATIRDHCVTLVCPRDGLRAWQISV